MAKEQQEQPKITRGQTLIDIPYKTRQVSFVYPGKGPGIYTDVCSAILKDNLTLPTGEQTAFFLDVAYNQLSKEPESQVIQGIMKNNWIWVPNKNLWVSHSHGYKRNAGVYVVYDKEGTGLTKSLYINELEKSLEDSEEISGVWFSRNGKVNFASRDSYQDGEQSAEDLAKSGFVRASYGIEGAKKLANLSNKFSSAPKLWIVDNPKEPELRVPTLLSDCDGDRLLVYGDNRGDNGIGFAFGVKRAAEGSEATREK